MFLFRFRVFFKHRFLLSVNILSDKCFFCFFYQCLFFNSIFFLLLSRYHSHFLHSPLYLYISFPSFLPSSNSPSLSPILRLSFSPSQLPCFRSFSFPCWLYCNDLYVSLDPLRMPMYSFCSLMCLSPFFLVLTLSLCYHPNI